MATDVMRVLFLTTDLSLVAAFTNILGELGIEPQSATNLQHASDRLNRAKYAGVVLDFDTVPDARSALSCVRESRSNKGVVVFAVATRSDYVDQALQGRAHFLLRRPIEPENLRRTLHSAYDLMLGESRRNFRHPANLSVHLTPLSSGASVLCSTINVSSNGMAVTASARFKLADMMDIRLALPDGFEVCASGIVVWQDEHGKCGVNFRCTTPQMRQKLDLWLDLHFSRHRPFAQSTAGTV